jgi:hypothetical protein
MFERVVQIEPARLRRARHIGVTQTSHVQLGMREIVHHRIEQMRPGA